ncbi:MAG TPA: hypothetical protein PLQ01_05040 [Methanothrix sp.]|nr:hypothetical protein [Methanothrix sp.]
MSNDEPEFYFRNFDGSVPRADIASWSLNLFQDKPGALKITCIHPNNISQDATVEVVYKKKILFRGFLNFPTQTKPGIDELSFNDRTSLLEHRFFMDCVYPGGTLLEDILSSGEPSPTAAKPGLIYQANSLIPQGAWQKYPYENNIFKKYGYGTNRLTITSIKFNNIELTKVTNKSSMHGGTWCQDADYLYIWCPTNENPNHSLYNNLLKYSTSSETDRPLRGCYYAGYGTYYMYYIPGGGASSVFGTVNKMYKDTSLLTKATSLSNMNSESKFYQDESNLYCYSSSNPNQSLYSVPNFKDTKLRVRNLYLSGYTFNSEFEMSKTNAQSALKELLSHINAEWQWIYDLDGYTYLDILNVACRGSETNPVKTFKESDLEDLKISYKEDFVPNIILGTGDPETYAAYGSWVPRNIWREANEDYENHNAETFLVYLQKRFEQINDSVSCSFKTEPDYSLQCGDYIRIIRNNKIHINKRIQKIQFTSANKMSLEIGQRDMDLNDAWDMVKKVSTEQQKRKIKDPYGFKWLSRDELISLIDERISESG